MYIVYTGPVQLFSKFQNDISKVTAPFFLKNHSLGSAQLTSFVNECKKVILKKFQAFCQREKKKKKNWTDQIALTTVTTSTKSGEIFFHEIDLFLYFTKISWHFTKFLWNIGKNQFPKTFLYFYIIVIYSFTNNFTY